MTKISLYLAGSIQKGHEKPDETFWTNDNMSFLKTCLQPFQVIYLNPAFRTDDLSDNRSVFGRDMLQVFSSDVVFVDARDRRGLGVGAEMMWAKLNRIPIVSWAPRNTHYRKDTTTVLGKPVNNFVHPFVECLSDKIVEDLGEGAAWILSLKSGKSQAIKGIESIQHAMEYYKAEQLQHDQPMRELMSLHKELEARTNNLVSLRN
jgi:hypothetical protein